MSVSSPLSRASALLQRGAFREAQAILESTLAEEPSNAEALHLLGLVRKQAGDLQGALEMLRRSVTIEPRRPEFLANLGNAFAALHRPTDATGAYRAALRLDPGFRMARLGLVRVLTQAGNTRDATSEARALIAANALDAEAWSALGAGLARQEDTREAIQAFEQAVSLKPGYGFARFGLGSLLLREFRAEEAYAQFELATHAGLDTAQLRNCQAQALLDLARFDEAEQLLQQTSRRWPEEAETHRLLAQLRYTRGDPSFARSVEEAAKVRPDQPTLPALLAGLLRRAGELERSEFVIREALQRFGATPQLTATLALTLQDQGRLEEALTFARQARAHAPDDPALTENVVVTLLALGQADAALPLIEGQRARHPHDQRWLAHLATAARVLGAAEYQSLYDYPRFVRPYELEVPRGWTTLEAFHADLLPALQSRHLLQAEPLDQSLRFGTQTARSLLSETDPAIRALLETLRNTVDRYRAELGFDEKHPYLQRNRGAARMAGCWSVRLRKGGYHVNHVHPAGWISSAYYAYVPAEVENAQLRSGWIKFGEPNVSTPGAPAAHFVQPRAGLLVLFPSYMWHGTTPIQGNEPRITVAFDVVPA